MWVRDAAEMEDGRFVAVSKDESLEAAESDGKVILINRKTGRRVDPGFISVTMGAEAFASCNHIDVIRCILVNEPAATTVDVWSTDNIPLCLFELVGDVWYETTQGFVKSSLKPVDMAGWNGVDPYTLLQPQLTT